MDVGAVQILAAGRSPNELSGATSPEWEDQRVKLGDLAG